jgi:hypothetical protein
MSRGVLLVALALAAGCHAPTPLARLGQVAPAAAVVRVDLGALRGGPGRKLLGMGFTEPSIVTARLTASGPGLATPRSADAAWSPVGTPPTLTLAVPSGPNMLFTLEGLDAAGRRVAVLRTLATVAPGATQALTLNANTDAAGRVLASLLAGPQAGDQPDASGIQAALAGADLTADLLAYVRRATGFNEAANTYGGVDPQRFRDRLLADRLRTSGAGALATAPDAPLLAAAGATVTVSVQDGGAAAQGVTVRILDHGSAAAVTGAPGTATVAGVAPGTWTVVATAGLKAAYGTVTVRDTEAGNVALALAAAQATPFTPPALPPLVGAPVAPAGTAPYVYTLAGASASNVVLDAFRLGGLLSGAAFGRVAVDAAGTLYFQLHDMLFKRTADGACQRLAWGTSAGPNAPVTGGSLVAFDVAADGTAYLVDDANKLYKIAPGGTPAFVMAFTAVSDVALGPDGRVYLREIGQITRYDPASGLAGTFATLAGAGPLAIDAATGTLYATSANQLWAITAAGVPAVLGGTAGGDVDGGAATARYASAGSFAVGGSSLYFPDMGNHHLRTVALASGAFSTLGGQPLGLADGALAGAAFDNPVSVAYDGARQALYVADANNYRLRRLDLATNQVSTVLAFRDPLHLEGTGAGVRFGFLGAVMVDAGIAYVADRQAGVIDAVDATGVATRWAGTGAANATNGAKLAVGLGADVKGLARDASGTTWVLGASLLQKIDAAGQVTGLAPTPMPAAIAAQAGGGAFAYVAGPPANLYTLDAAGALTLVPGTNAPAGGRCLAVDDAGTAYVATASKVWKRPAGGTFTQLTPTFGDVAALAVDDADKHLFVVDGLHVYELGPGGSVATVLVGAGGGGADVDGAAAGAGFGSIPTGLAAAGGKVYVTELDRVRVIQR